MKEIGIDISRHRSKSVSEFLEVEFDYVITVCDNANQRCPVFPGNVRRIHWSIDDPVVRRAQDWLRALRPEPLQTASTAHK